MDDEEIVRDTTGKMLNYLGYEVKFAKEGKEAVTVYKKYFDTKEHFDFVILDLSIPGGMGGEETIKLLKTINPFIKAIVFSGYYHNPVISNYLDYGFSGVLKKPFDFYELENIILRMSNE
ncbi:MAG: hypothetical protein A2086_12865 [Spirochaetes bacterium GWD1_27_9]|nr:MAG: hypothetical protein A2Z98_00670 [Spirochaetes bacterium GWB1_27_13]OHD24762.1 MAG: hypothetical protein A2Y34_08415 [Spirochaetes bacterium GWC1_27_15]OHD43982.1 MAG: hypothetical protein A2086_12865 [Spirochaetes bacterium GWD1_27_9]